MSKSLGNFFTVRDLLDKGVPGEVIRFVMLSTHYRKPMDWTEKKRKEAEATLRKWHLQTKGIVADLSKECATGALADDLNTSEVIMRMHSLSDQGEVVALKATAEMLGLLTPELSEWSEFVSVRDWVKIERYARDQGQTVSEISFEKMSEIIKLPLSSIEYSFSEYIANLEAFSSVASPLALRIGDFSSLYAAEIETADLDEAIANAKSAHKMGIVELIHERTESRRLRDWSRADSVRDLITERGFDIVDTAEGTKWRMFS